MRYAQELGSLLSQTTAAYSIEIFKELELNGFKEQGLGMELSSTALAHHVPKPGFNPQYPPRSKIK